MGLGEGGTTEFVENDCKDTIEDRPYSRDQNEKTFGKGRVDGLLRRIFC